MKIRTAVIALASVLFTAPAFADHNRVDQYGLKQGHRTESPGDGVLAAEGDYVDGKRHGQWVSRSANDGKTEGQKVNGKAHGEWVYWDADGRESVLEFALGVPLRHLSPSGG